MKENSIFRVKDKKKYVFVAINLSIDVRIFLLLPCILALTVLKKTQISAKYPKLLHQ